MKKKINNPKVFISYAWSSKEYQERVMNLATRLRGDGIEVLIDKWMIDPGADTINFMEKCVKDSSVNYVLMLLDEKYAEKADSRKGGVGIETQIISNEVYSNVEETKFIPIIFDRNVNGEVCVPVYLKSRYYYDLTKEDLEEQYVNLVKHLYGVETYKIPELGNKPSWVDTIQNESSSLFFSIINSDSNKNFLEELLIEIKNSNLEKSIKTFDNDAEKVKNNLEVYKKSLEYRNEFIEICLKNNNSTTFIDDICEFYENIIAWNNKINYDKNLIKEIWEAYIHETFIYLITILFKYKKYNNINLLITKSYFENNEVVNSNHYFYSHDYNIINYSKATMDNKKYHSPVAQLWIENVYEPKLSKDDITAADLLIYNLSILLLEDQRWYWFPITYVYSGNSRYNSSITTISIKLKSKYEVKKLYELFGVDSIESAREKFSIMEKFVKDRQERYRYSGSFECAELFLDFVKKEEIGSVN